MSVNSVLQGSVNLGTFSIPISGTDAWVRITFAERVEITDALDGDAVKNLVPYRRATMTLNALPGSVSHALIRQIAAADDQLLGRLSLPGAARDATSAQVITWAQAALVQEPDFVIQKTVEPATATFALMRVRATQSIVALLAAQVGA